MVFKMNDDVYEVPVAAVGLLVGIRNCALMSAGFWTIVYFVIRAFGA